VDGILLALDHPSHPYDVYNIGSGQSRSTAEIAAVVREPIPGADLSVGPGPHRFTDEMVVPKKGALDIIWARTVLGYQPKYDLRQGLAANIEWYRRGRPVAGLQTR
jgi:nucleoside-diphosphate-sugar epimerase